MPKLPQTASRSERRRNRKPVGSKARKGTRTFADNVNTGENTYSRSERRPRKENSCRRRFPDRRQAASREHTERYTMTAPPGVALSRLVGKKARTAKGNTASNVEGKNNVNGWPVVRRAWPAR